jgi:hypothetical protein
MLGFEGVFLFVTERLCCAPTVGVGSDMLAVSINDAGIARA